MRDGISEGHQVDLLWKIRYVLACSRQVQEIPFQNLIESSMSITKFAEKKRLVNLVIIFGYSNSSLS